MFIETKTLEKAQRVLDRFTERLEETLRAADLEPYYKGGFVCSFHTEVRATEWSEAVYEVIELVQRVGRSWVITGSVDHSPSFDTRNLQVPGVTFATADLLDAESISSSNGNVDSEDDDS